MAWPFSNNTGNIRDADAEVSEERLKILSNEPFIEIEPVLNKVSSVLSL